MAAVQKRRIRWAISLFLVMLYFSGLTAQAQYGGGTGEPNDPYLIYTAEQMNAIGAEPNDFDKHFKLMADIDLSSYTGTDFNIIGINWDNPFTGVFDGSGKKISNFTYTSTDTNRIGLFGYVGGAIKDLGLINPNVDAGTGNSVGSLVGDFWSGTITNCYVEGGSVSGAGSEYSGGVGGLVGDNRGTITNCYSSGGVTGATNVGGLVGLNNYGTITNCTSSGSVTGATNVGGLVGLNNYGTITNCTSSGSVAGTTNVGGLVGENRYTISNCYSTGNVSGSSTVGGLVGLGSPTRVYNSFWDIQTSGQVTSGGGTGKTTAEMQNPNTFMDAGWDFVGKPDGPHDVWAEPAGGGYPILWWQFSPLPELPFSGGTGELDDPYLVSTAAELNSIGHNPRLMDAHFMLINDIDLTEVDFFIIGNELFPFAGVFDGDGFIISNFTYDSNDTNYIGLFGYISGENTKIKDLGLFDPNIDAGTGDTVGSLVGNLQGGTITNCYAEGGSVSGTWTVGGLVGGNNGTITKCYSSADILGDRSVGGLVGRNSGTIADCYSTSSVVGIEHVGGLVGSGGSAHNSFWDIQTSGQSTSAGGKGRTTVQMQMASTFLGWDECGNEGVWTIDEGNDYPRLWWENKPGEVLDTKQLSALLTGAGTDDDPYLIYTAEELNVIGVFPCEWGKNFKLMSDIDLSQYVGTEFNIIGIPSPFSGVFDGNGKKITNLNHTNGLFVSVSGAIKDLGLIDSNIEGIGSSVGSLVGHLKDGTISNCYAEGGSVSGDLFVGGLVGDNHGTITNCYAEGGSVSGDFFVGGLVGDNHGTITNCYSSASVSGGWRVGGGLVGRNGEGGTIDNSYATGSVTGDWSGVGGLVGDNSGAITKCYSMGSVSGTGDVGGLVGENYGTITNCYATGSVTGDRSSVGGLVGDNEGTISDCSSAGNVMGTRDVGGLVGTNGDTITNCYASGSVSGDDSVGGLVGTNSYGSTITNCYSSGDVSASGAYAYSGVGGLVGENSWGGTITNCYSTGSVTGTTNVGGLVGTNEWGTITNCYASGSVSGDDSVGGLVGTNSYDSTITNCYSSGDVSASGAYAYSSVGGLVGENSWGGTITNCYSTGSVTGTTNVGGLVGNNGYSGTITNCYAEGGSVMGDWSVGGLVGSNAGTITNCYAEDGSVMGTGLGVGGVGGLVGFNSEGTITNCYATGGVSGDDKVGGLVGENWWTITNCYATGGVSGDDKVGGLVGKNLFGTITNCYSAGSVLGMTDTGGLVGENPWGEMDSFWDTQTSGQVTSAGGTGKTTAEMQMASTFTDAGWDFVGESVNGTEDIWSICEGTNYPRLLWQIPAGDFVCPDGITIEDFVFFIEHWRDDNCDLSNDYCDGTDLDFSGTVDEADLEILIENWLADSN